MLNKLLGGLLLLVSTLPANSAAVGLLGWQIDKTPVPSTVCLNYTSAQCLTIGTISPTAFYSTPMESALKIYPVDLYGALHNLVADDSTAIQTALNAASAAGGGKVYIGPYQYLASTTITVPKRVSLECSAHGGDVIHGFPYDYTSRKCSIYSAVTGTTPAIQLNGAMRNITLIQDRVRTLGDPAGTPGPTTRAKYVTLTTGYTGIGVKIGDGTNPGPANSTLIEHSIIGGFDTCMKTHWSAQDHKNYVFMDCNTFYDLEESHDNDKNNHLEGWAFLTGLRTGNNGVGNSWAVTAMANSGGLIRLTTASHDLVPGETVYVQRGVGGQGMIGRWVVSDLGLDSTHITLTGSEYAPVRNGTTVDGATLVTGLTGLGSTNLRMGMTVSGTGIPAGAKIAMVLESQEAFHLDLPATASGTIALTIASSAFTPSSALAIWDGNWRSGKGFYVHNSEGANCFECYAYAVNEPFVFDDAINIAFYGAVADGIHNRADTHALKVTTGGGILISGDALAGNKGVYIDSTSLITIQAPILIQESLLEIVGAARATVELSNTHVGNIHLVGPTALVNLGSTNSVGSKVYTSGVSAPDYFGAPLLAGGDRSYYPGLATIGMRINSPQGAAILYTSNATALNHKKWQTIGTATTGEFNTYAVSDDEGTLLKYLSLKRPSGVAHGFIEIAQPLIFSGTVPTCSSTGTGTSPACAFTTGSNDSAGEIIMTAGTGSPAALGTLTLTFAIPKTGNNPTCNVWTQDTGTAWNVLASPVRISTQSLTAPVFKWNNNAVALSVSTPYHFGYNCSGK